MLSVIKPSGIRGGYRPWQRNDFGQPSVDKAISAWVSYVSYGKAGRAAYPKYGDENGGFTTIGQQENDTALPEEIVRWLTKMQSVYEDRIVTLERRLAKLQEPDKPPLNDRWQQSDTEVKVLESIFDIDPDDEVGTRELDGLLSDCVDKNQNSLDLVRSVRGG